MAAGIQATIFSLIYERNNCQNKILDLVSLVEEAADRTEELNNSHSANIADIEDAYCKDSPEYEIAMAEEEERFNEILHDLMDFDTETQNEKTVLEGKLVYVNNSIESFNKILNKEISQDFKYGSAAGGG